MNMPGTKRMPGVPRRVAGLAAAGLEEVSHALRLGTGHGREGARLGHAHHREPVHRRVVLRRFRRRRGDDRGEIQRASRVPAHLRRVDEPVAAHPDVVARARQIRNQVAPGVVGDDDPRRLVGSSSVSAITHTPASGLRLAAHEAADVGAAGTGAAAVSRLSAPARVRREVRVQKNRGQSPNSHGESGDTGKLGSDPIFIMPPFSSAGARGRCSGTA
jgi:hypothetical protein